MVVNIPAGRGYSRGAGDNTNTKVLGGRVGEQAVVVHVRKNTSVLGLLQRTVGRNVTTSWKSASSPTPLINDHIYFKNQKPPVRLLYHISNSPSRSSIES